jgi:hypothetical protein
MEGCRRKLCAGLIQQQAAEPQHVSQRCAEVVGHRVKHGFQLRGGCPDCRTPLGNSPLQFRRLPGQLLAKPGLLNGDGDRGGDLERDVPVLRVESRRRG